MTIRDLIHRDFATAGPYEGINSIKKIIFQKGPVVVLENGVYLGILTAIDLLVKPYNVVIDCLVSKPSATPAHSIAEAWELMRRSNEQTLPVHENGQFVGIITANDLSAHLQKVTDDQKYALQSTAHDLKNPILNILSLASLLRTDLEKEETEEIARDTEQACRYAMDIINGLLSNPGGTEAEDVVKFEITEINALLKECVKNILPQAKAKSITLADEIAHDEFYFPVQQLKLSRAINNLLFNAIKFTASGGRITVSTSQNGSSATIRIQDSGIGIPTALQPVIFNKFTNAKRLGTNFEPSTGLGLFITKQIIEQHKGKIWFESSEQTGTVFYISFEKENLPKNNAQLNGESKKHKF